jgi:hypothetical protein
VQWKPPDSFTPSELAGVVAPTKTTANGKAFSFDFIEALAATKLVAPGVIKEMSVIWIVA